MGSSELSFEWRGQYGRGKLGRVTQEVKVDTGVCETIVVNNLVRNQYTEIQIKKGI